VQIIVVEINKIKLTSKICRTGRGTTTVTLETFLQQNMAPNDSIILAYSPL